MKTPFTKRASLLAFLVFIGYSSIAQDDRKDFRDEAKRPKEYVPSTAPFAHEALYRAKTPNQIGNCIIPKGNWF